MAAGKKFSRARQLFCFPSYSVRDYALGHVEEVGKGYRSEYTRREARKTVGKHER